MFNEQRAAQEEEDTMKAVMEAYKEYGAALEKRMNGLKSKPMELLFCTTADPGATYWDINREVIARSARNIRNTRSFLNKLLRWINILRNQRTDTPIAKAGMTIDRSTCSTEWLGAIALFYQKRIMRQLAQLGDAVKPPPSLPNTPLDEATSATKINQILQAAQLCVVENVCDSPVFIQVLKSMPEISRAFKFCASLVAQSVGDRPSSFQQTSYLSVIGTTFSTSHWLFHFFVLFLASMRLHHRNLLRTGDSAGGADLHRQSSQALAQESGSTGDAALITESQLREVSSALNELLAMSVPRTARSSDVINSLVLHYVQSSCTETFPRARNDALLQVAEEAQLPSTMLSESAQGLGMASMNAENTQQTVQQLSTVVLRQVPEFLRKVEGFTRSVGVKTDMMQLLVLTQVLCCRPDDTPTSTAAAPENHTNGHDSSKAAAKVDHDDDDTMQCADTFLYRALCVILRPLIYRLLSVQPPAVSEGAGGTGEEGEEERPDSNADAAGGQAGGGSAAVGELSPAQQAARNAIIAEIKACVDFKLLTGVAYAQWESLGLGPAPTRTVRLGQECVQLALKTVVRDAVRSMIVWLTVVRSDWVNPPKPTRMSAVSDDSLHKFFGYLMPAEIAFHALTNAGADPSIPDILQQNKSLLYTTVASVLREFYPGNADYALVLPIVNSVHNYLLRREEAGEGAVSGAGGAGPVRRPPPGAVLRKKMPPPPMAGAAAVGEDGDAAAAPGQRQPPLLPRGNVVRVVTLPNEAAMHAALRLVECLVERDTFVRKYAEVMKRRLLARPPPGRVRDELLDQSKRICEKEAIDYLRSRLVDASDLGSLRSIYESYQPTYVSGTEEGGAPSDAAKETKLVVNVLDWRYWDTNAAEYQDMQQVTANQPQGTSGAAGGVPSQEAPLPVPHELLTVMDRFQNDYQSKHGGKTLKWHLLANAYCTFTLQYPKDEGRVTTVHGSVLLNQLFLAIAQYKRQGVAFTTLAHRAKMEPKKVMALLGRFIKQDKLLTLVPGSGSGESQCVSLNYDFTRPPESRHGEFAGGWPKPVRFANAINREEQEAIRISRMMQVQVSVIQIMKSKHAIAFEELTEQVKAKVANKFDLSMQLLKAVIEELVEKAFIERAIMDNGAKGFHYLS